MNNNERLGREFTVEERRRLIDYFDVLIDMDQLRRQDRP